MEYSTRPALKAPVLNVLASTLQSLNLLLIPYPKHKLASTSFTAFAPTCTYAGGSAFTLDEAQAGAVMVKNTNNPSFSRGGA